MRIRCVLKMMFLLGVFVVYLWTGAVNNLVGSDVVAFDQDFGEFSDQFDRNEDPGFQFRLEEGNKALERSAAARGGVLSGASAKGIARYSQGLASQKYQNSFNPNGWKNIPMPTNLPGTEIPDVPPIFPEPPDPTIPRY